MHRTGCHPLDQPMWGVTTLVQWMELVHQGHQNHVAPKRQLVPTRSGKDLHATSRRRHHHLAKWATNPARRGLGCCQCASISTMVQNRTWRDRAPPLVQHEDFGIVPFSMSVMLKTIITNLAQLEHLVWDLSIGLGRTWVARLSHSNAPQTVTSVPQTWFTTRDGTNMEDASKHLRFESAASIKHILEDLPSNRRRLMDEAPEEPGSTPKAHMTRDAKD